MHKKIIVGREKRMTKNNECNSNLVQMTVSDVRTQNSTTSEYRSQHRDCTDSILIQEASSTVYSLTWNKQQYEEFSQKNSWMYAFVAKIGRTRKVNNRQKEHNVVSLFLLNGRSATSLLTVAQKKYSFYHCAKRSIKTNSKAHKKAIIIIEMAKKNVLLNLNAQSEPTAFPFTDRVFGTVCHATKNNKPFTDFVSLIDLQQDNSLDTGRVFHSKIVAVDIMDDESSQMKNDFLSKIIERRRRINILAHESMRVSHKST